MTFEEILDHAIAMIERRGRVTYRTLKRQFDLDDDALEDLKEELLYSHPARDDEGRGLVWTGEVGSPVEPTATITEPDHPAVTHKSQPTQAKPPPAPHTPEAERRQLTVMFCDLVGSTELSGQLDAENLRDVIRAYQSTSAEVIERYGGYIAQHLGDGLMVYFGWPQAHEDDAQRAVHTGLGILEALVGLNARLEQENGMRLAVRIGMHTGLVVVGAIGQGASQEHLALGETPNVASRIEGVAEPDTVAISAATYQLVQGYFDCVALGLQTLKGIDEAQQVYRVMGEGELSSRFMAATAMGLTALVGRDEEIALLRKRWAQATTGEGQVVLLSGEAGIGKSRIIQALRAQLADDTYLDMQYQCSPYHTTTAFYPITEQFAVAAGFTRRDTPDEKLDKLEAHLRLIGLAIPEVAPLFAEALSLATAGRYPPLDITPQRQKERTIEALASRLLAAAQHQPVLFIAEDLHWSDPSSLETIGRIMAHLAEARVLIVCTYRPAFEVPWGLDGPITTLRLNRLSRSQTARLIRNVTAGKPLPPEVVAQLVAKSDGVPLYVEELTKHVLESGWLDDKGDHYELKGALPPLAIPVTLRDALTARLDRLPAAREVAQLGAVLGREFTYELIQGISSQNDEMLQVGLAQLVEAELLYERGRPPRARYLFKHALIQDAAYASLLKSTRQRVHKQIAELFETRFPEVVEVQPELVAHHYSEAEQPEDAIRYWCRASERSNFRSAHVEALSHIARGLELLTLLPATPERTEHEIALSNTRALALVGTEGLASPAVEAAYTRTYDLCQQNDDRSQLFSATFGLCRLYSVRGEFERSLTFAEQLITLAQGQHDPASLSAAHWLMGANLLWCGEGLRARTHLEEGIALCLHAHDRTAATRYGQDPGVMNRLFASLTLWLLGYPDQAVQHSEEALARAQKIAHFHSEASALVFAAWLRQLRQEEQLVYERAEAALALSAAHGFTFWVAHGTFWLGWAQARQGQWREGIARMQQGLDDRQAHRAGSSQSMQVTELAGAYGHVGQIDKASTLLTEAFAIVAQTGERFYEAELYRLRGAFSDAQSPEHQNEAEAYFHKALDVARRQQAKSWELRAATSLARLWQSQGKRQAAYDLLAPVYGWFTEGFDTADLKDANALLAGLRS